MDNTHVQVKATKELKFRKYIYAILREGRYCHKKTQILPHYQLYTIYIHYTTKQKRHHTRTKLHEGSREMRWIL